MNRVQIYIDEAWMLFTLDRIFKQQHLVERYFSENTEWNELSNRLAYSVGGICLRTFWFVDSELVKEYPPGWDTKNLKKCAKLILQHAPPRLRIQFLRKYNAAHPNERWKVVRRVVDGISANFRRTQHEWSRRTEQLARIREQNPKTEISPSGLPRWYNPVSQTFSTQKGVDMDLGTTLAINAYRDQFDTAILITGDADFAVAAKKVKATGKQVVGVTFSNETGRRTRATAKNLVNTLDLLIKVSYSDAAAIFDLAA